MQRIVGTKELKTQQYRECKTEAFAKARYRCLQGAGATACLRPIDLIRVIPAAEFVGVGRPFLGIEEHVAVRCPWCDAVGVDTRHVRICSRSGAQVNQHQLLLHAMSRTLKRFGISHQAESRRTVRCGKEPVDGHHHQERKSSRRFEQGV